MNEKNKKSCFQAHPYLVFFLLLVVLWIGFVQVMRSGFCLSDMHFYSKEEVLSKVARNRLDENKDCCTLHDGLGFGQWKGVEKWLNVLFYPEYIGYVESYFQKDFLKRSPDTIRPYYKELQVSNQCGDKSDRYGIAIATEAYQAALVRNQKHLKKQGE